MEKNMILCEIDWFKDFDYESLFLVFKSRPAEKSKKCLIYKRDEDAFIYSIFYDKIKQRDQLCTPFIKNFSILDQMYSKRIIEDISFIENNFCTKMMLIDYDNGSICEYLESIN